MVDDRVVDVYEQDFLPATDEECARIDAFRQALRTWPRCPRYDVTGVIHVTHGFEDEQSSSLRVWDRVNQTAHAIELTDDLLAEWIGDEDTVGHNRDSRAGGDA